MSYRTSARFVRKVTGIHEAVSEEKPSDPSVKGYRGGLSKISGLPSDSVSHCLGPFDSVLVFKILSRTFPRGRDEPKAKMSHVMKNRGSKQMYKQSEDTLPCSLYQVTLWNFTPSQLFIFPPNSLHF